MERGEEERGWRQIGGKGREGRVIGPLLFKL
jgi:hypothetical protein